MTDDKQKARDRKRILRRLARQSITEKPRNIKGLVAEKRNVKKPKRESKRSPLYGQPTVLKLPALGNRIRGRTSPPTISGFVIDAIRRQEVDRLAERAAKLAGTLAANEMNKGDKKDDAEPKDDAGGTQSVGPV